MACIAYDLVTTISCPRSLRFAALAALSVRIGEWMGIVAPIQVQGVLYLGSWEWAGNSPFRLTHANYTADIH